MTLKVMWKTEKTSNNVTNASIAGKIYWVKRALIINHAEMGIFPYYGYHIHVYVNFWRPWIEKNFMQYKSKAKLLNIQCNSHVPLGRVKKRKISSPFGQLTILESLPKIN